MASITHAPKTSSVAARLQQHEDRLASREPSTTTAPFHPSNGPPSYSSSSAPASSNPSNSASCHSSVAPPSRHLSNSVSRHTSVAPPSRNSSNPASRHVSVAPNSRNASNPSYHNASIAPPSRNLSNPSSRHASIAPPSREPSIAPSSRNLLTTDSQLDICRSPSAALTHSELADAEIEPEIIEGKNPTQLGSYVGASRAVIEKAALAFACRLHAVNAWPGELAPGWVEEDWSERMQYASPRIRLTSGIKTYVRRLLKFDYFF
jgi:hypothetical protein